MDRLISGERGRARLVGLDYAEAYRLFAYDPNTGFLLWKVRTSIRVVIGQVVGTPNADGRRKLRLRGKNFLCARIVWLMHKGEWPDHQLDHINGNPTDDRIENLRPATHAENCWNKPARPDSSIGLKGVWRCRDKFQAGISINKKRLHLGSFLTAEAAASAYADAAKKYHKEFANSKGA